MPRPSRLAGFSIGMPLMALVAGRGRRPRPCNHPADHHDTDHQKTMDERLYRRTNLASHSTRSLPDIAIRDEAKEVRQDARLQARKNRRCTRWNTLMIFSGRERRRWLQIIRRSRTVNIGQTPRKRSVDVLRVSSLFDHSLLPDQDHRNGNTDRPW
jgi:hypothetical protein